MLPCLLYLLIRKLTVQNHLCCCAETFEQSLLTLAGTRGSSFLRFFLSIKDFKYVTVSVLFTLQVK